MALIGMLDIGTRMLTSGVTKGANTVAKSLQQIGKASLAVEPMLSSLQARLIGLVGAGATAGLAKYTLSLAAAAEQSQVAFSTMLRSQEAATQLIGEIRRFAKETPFQQQELLDASKQLLAFGFSAREVVPWLRRLGDVSSALGAPIGDLAYLFGTARTQGRLFAVDIRQLTARGIPIIDALNKRLGTTGEQLMKMVEEGQITAKTVEQAFMDMTSAGGQFYRMTEAQSKTLAGRWNTLKDSVVLSLTEIGEAMATHFNLKTVTAQVTSLADSVGKLLVPAISNVGQVFAKIGPDLVVFTSILAAVTAGFLAAQAAIKATAVAMVVLQALSGPKGWFTLAVGLAAAKYGADFATSLLDQAGATLAPQLAPEVGIGSLPTAPPKPPQMPQVDEQQDGPRYRAMTEKELKALKMEMERNTKRTAHGLDRIHSDLILLNKQRDESGDLIPQLKL